MKVAIIGSGVAGSALGAMLKFKRFDVALFDENREREMVVGESLIPAMIPVFERLGIEKEIEAISERKPGVSFIFGPAKRFEFSFAAVRGILPEYAYNSPRPAFDNILRDRAARGGCHIVNSRASLEVKDGRPALSEATLDKVPRWGGRQPDLIIDATGRGRALSHLLALPAKIGRRKDVAYFAHFEGIAPEKPRGQVLITRLRRGWCWRIPLPGRMSVGIVVDKEAAAALGRTPEERIERALREEPALKDDCSEARRITEVQTYANYQLISEKSHGSNWVLLGDSFGFIDPMLSSGAHIALASAVQLEKELDRWPLAMALPLYSRWMRRQLQCWGRLVGLFYSGEIFGMHETGTFLTKKYECGLSKRIRAFIEKRIACTASGAYITSHFSWQMLSFLQGQASWTCDFREFAVD